MALSYGVTSDCLQPLEVCHTSFNQMPGKQLKKPWGLDFRLLTDPDLSRKAFPMMNRQQHHSRTPPKRASWADRPELHGFLEAGNGHSPYRCWSSGLRFFCLVLITGLLSSWRGAGSTGTRSSLGLGTGLLTPFVHSKHITESFLWPEAQY